MKKTFISIICMTHPNKLERYRYIPDKGLKEYPKETKFPMIVSMYNNIKKNDDVRVVSIILNEWAEKNYEAFLEEIEQLKTDLGISFEIMHKVIKGSVEETVEYNAKFFEQVLMSYDENSEINMDITYGQKPKTVALFSSLLYAEKAMKCSVESIVYGRVDWQTNSAYITDISFTYMLNSIIALALENGNEDIKGIVDLLLKLK